MRLKIFMTRKEDMVSELEDIHNEIEDMVSEIEDTHDKDRGHGVRD